MKKIFKAIIIVLMGILLFAGCTNIYESQSNIEPEVQNLATKGASSLSKCIIQNRPDILPFYKSNGWNTSENNWDNIIANWCSIDPSGCAAEKAKCQSGGSSNVFTDSQYNSSYSGKLAVDGNNGTKWCSTNASSQHWLVYDLGSSKRVTGFTVRHAGSNGEWADFNTKRYSIYYSNSSKNGPWNYLLYYNNSAKSSVTTNALSSPVNGRFFKLQIWESSFVDNYARIYEFQVLTGSVAPSILNVPYTDQYEGQTSENHDCGPACVAMVVDYRNKRPSGINNYKDFMIQIRNVMNVGANINTGFGNLKTALSHYGISSAYITNAATPQPTAQVNQMKTAIAAGRPVIALVHGATLGRGSKYGDHWIVVRGFSADGQSVYVNDPDNQGARWDGWIQGGQITLTIQKFKDALYNAAAGDYGITVY